MDLNTEDDWQEIKERITKTVDLWKEAANEMLEAFRMIADSINGILPRIKERLEIKRIKYKPILKIHLKKVHIKDKKITTHYCRNNC